MWSLTEEGKRKVTAWYTATAVAPTPGGLDTFFKGVEESANDERQYFTSIKYYCRGTKRLLLNADIDLVWSGPTIGWRPWKRA